MDKFEAMCKFSLWCSFLLMVACSASNFKELFKWKQIAYETRSDLKSPSAHGTDFLFPDNEDGKSDNSYIPYNNIPMGICIYNEKLFITVPRRRPGIPSTLNFVSTSDAGSVLSPTLRPFPDDRINSLAGRPGPEERRIVSVYRPRVDVCNRIWFIDTGMLEYPGNRTQIQKPAIWVVMLNTEEIIHVFDIPKSIVAEGRGLASITVDINNNKCDKAMAYIPDLVQNVLYVYSYDTKKMWTFRHNYFHFDPLGGDLSIAGQDFRWNDGIFSITLGSKGTDGFKTAYFHALASTSEFTVSTQIIRNESLSRRSYHGQDFQFLGNRGNKRQSSMHVYESNTKVVFYAEIAQNGIGCWNTNKPYTRQNQGIIQQNLKTMIYPSDITVDQTGNVWAMTNTMPLFIYSQLDVNEYNFRIWQQSAVEAIKNTVCDG